MHPQSVAGFSYNEICHRCRVVGSETQRSGIGGFRGGFSKTQNLQRPAAQAALYLRSVCWFITAFHGLRCHPPTCMSLNLRLSADSIPSALTTLRINNLEKIPTKFSNSLHSPLPPSSSVFNDLHSQQSN